MRLGDPEVLVNADEDHLKQLLLNLIINAVEALGDKSGMVVISGQDVAATQLPEPQGPPDKTKDGAAVQAPDWLRLTVADDGPGISKDIHKKVWQPFFSTKRAGTGLGLAVVQRLVENLSGQIALDSTPGKGTAIHIFLKKHTPRQHSIDVKPELITH